MENNMPGLIKWEQALCLGNSKYGVDLSPVDFVKFAQCCGPHGLGIEDPRQCRQQLREGLAIDGPALIECVVGPLKWPWPPQITRGEARNLFPAMRRGERNTRPIGHHTIQAFAFGQSPFGIAGRVIDRFTGYREEPPENEKAD